MTQTVSKKSEKATMTKDEMLLEMQLEAEVYLMKIEEVFRRWGLHLDGRL